MRQSFTLTLAFMLLAIGLQAQHHYCGTTGEDLRLLEQRLMDNKRALQEGLIVNRNETRYVPVKFHLIGETNGEGRVRINRVLNQLCALNEDFEPHGIQFYIKDGLNYIYNDQAFNNHISVENSILSQNRDQNAMNIFIPKDANVGSGSGGVVLGYYNIPRDWVVIGKPEMGASSITVPHEVGHFFSLLHPFNGWEGQAWDPDLHGNPVTQTLAPDGFTRVEVVDGSNCDFAADRLCDTPPNYGFGLGWPDCDFTEEVQDRNGDVLDPDEKLFMDYFFGCSRTEYYFSEDQVNAMHADYDHPSRAYIRSSYIPNQDEITAEPQLNSPEQGATLTVFDQVTFNWDAVDGATAYNIQVAQEPSFTSPVYDEVVTGTSVNVTNLEPTRLHFWRVRPFNEYYTCTNFSDFQVFTTGTLSGTTDPGFAQTFEASPNPIKPGQPIQLRIVLEHSAEAQFNLYTAAGQRVQRLGTRQLRTGENRFQLPLSGLKSGACLLERANEQQHRQFIRLMVVN